MVAGTRGALIGCCALALALTLSACGSQHPPAEVVPPPAAFGAALCDPDVSAGRVPDGFAPVTAYLCEDEMLAPAPGAGAALPSPSEGPLTGDLDPLLAALAASSDPPWPGPCTADMMIVPQVWLVDADDNAIRVAPPVTGCGKPKWDPIAAALENLRTS